MDLSIDSAAVRFGFPFRMPMCSSRRNVVRRSPPSACRCPDWSFDARLAVENSRLSFSGDAEQSVYLTYVKPRLQLSRQFGPHQLQVRAFRDVSQLDFTDFVSAASLSDDVINGGNPDLRPQTAWVAEIGADLRMPGDAALRTRVFHQWLDDVVDLIPQGPPIARIDAPGNIGTRHTRWRGGLAATAARACTAWWQVQPVRNLAGLSVRDPVTNWCGDHLRFGRNQGKAELRQDLPAAKISWGVSYAAESATLHTSLDGSRQPAEELLTRRVRGDLVDPEVHRAPDDAVDSG